MPPAQLVYENELHYHVHEVETPDYLNWLVDETLTFAYGYLAPEARVRLKLMCPDEPVSEFNVRSAVLETKVFVGTGGNARVKTVCDLSVKQAVAVYGLAQRTLTKTLRTYRASKGTWQLSFSPATFDLTAAEFVFDSSTDVDPPESPNFVLAPFDLVGENEFYTYRQSTPRS